MDITTRTSQLASGDLLEKDIQVNLDKIGKFKKYLTHITVEVSPVAKSKEQNNKAFKAGVWVHGFKKQYKTEAKSSSAKTALDEACKDMVRLIVQEKERLHDKRTDGARKIKNS